MRASVKLLNITLLHHYKKILIQLKIVSDTLSFSKTETIELEDVKDPKRTCGKRCSDSRDCLSMERCRLYKDECHMTCEKISVISSRGNFN